MIGCDGMQFGALRGDCNDVVRVRGEPLQARQRQMQHQLGIGGLKPPSRNWPPLESGPRGRGPLADGCTGPRVAQDLGEMHGHVPGNGGDRFFVVHRWGRGRRRCRCDGVFDGKVLSQQHAHGPLRQRGDGEQGIDAQRAWNNRPVQHVQPWVHGAVGASDRLESAPRMIDHAGGRVVAHGAAAERMDGKAGATPRRAVERRRHGAWHGLRPGAAQQQTMRAKNRIQVPVLNGGNASAFLRRIDQPQSIRAPVVLHAPQRRIVTHEQQCLSPGEAAGLQGSPVHGVLRSVRLLRPHGPRGELREHAAGGHQLVKDAGQGSWNRGILNQDFLLQSIRIAPAQAAADRRSDARHLPREPGRALADAVDGAVGQVSDGQVVAIGRQPTAEPAGKAQSGACVLAAQQELGAAQRAGCDEHMPRPDAKLGHVGAFALALAIGGGNAADAPMLTRAFQLQRRDPRVQARARRFGTPQIGVRQGLLGIEVAPGDAFAATDARVRRKPSPRIQGVAARIGLTNGQVQWLAHVALAAFGGAPAHRCNQFAQALGLQRHVETRSLRGIRTRADQGGGAHFGPKASARRFKMRRHGRAVDSRRPGAPALGDLVEYPRIGLDRHAGVDLAAAAQCVAHQRTHALAQAQIEQGGLVAGQLRGRAVVDADLAKCPGQPVRELAALPFEATLEHRDLHVGLRKPLCGDGAAVARTNDHRLQHGVGSAGHPFAQGADAAGQAAIVAAGGVVDLHSSS